MAFLCPSRSGRNKHRKEEYGDTVHKGTDDDDYEAILQDEKAKKLHMKDPEHLRIILQNFTSCSPEELTVKQGQKVHFIYRENDWAYVVTSDKKEGFVPFIYCAKLGHGPNRTEPKYNHDRFKQYQPVYTQRNTSLESADEFRSVSDHANDSIEWLNDSDTEDVFQSVGNHFHPELADDFHRAECFMSLFDSVPQESLPPFLKSFHSQRAGAGTPESQASDDEVTVTVSPRDRPDVNGLFDQSSHDEEEHLEGSFASEEASNKFLVLHNYEGYDEEEITVRAGETVYGVDTTDEHWILVQAEDGSQGLMPRYYTEPIANDTGGIKPEEPPFTLNEDVSINNTKASDNMSVDESLTNHHSSVHNLERKQSDSVVYKPDGTSSVNNSRNSEPTNQRDKTYTCEFYTPANNKEQTSYKFQEEKQPAQNTKCNSNSDSRLRSYSNSFQNSTHQTLTNWNTQSTVSQEIVATTGQVKPKFEQQKTDKKPHPDKPPRAHKKQSPQNQKDKDPAGNRSANNRTNPSKMNENSKKHEYHSESARVCESPHITSPESHHNASRRSSDYSPFIFADSPRAHSKVEIVRPQSVSPYQSYVYEKEKREYYDEYFYDEPNSRRKEPPRENVINVSEILKLRPTKSQEKRNKRSIPINLREYMLLLPSTKLGNNSTDEGVNGGMCFKTTSDTNPDAKHRNDAADTVHPSSPCETKPTTKGAEKGDWSFGFPRKDSKHNEECPDSEEDSQSQRDHELRRENSLTTYANLSDSSVFESDFDDDAMDELLSTTDSLLDTSQRLLSERTKARRILVGEKEIEDGIENSQNENEQHTEKATDENGDEFCDVAEKCNHFLSQQMMPPVLNGDMALNCDDELQNNIDDRESVIATQENNDKMPDSVPENTSLSDTSSSIDSKAKEENSRNERNSCTDVRGITEFMALYDYQAESATDMSLRRGEILHISLDEQEDEDWYWAHSPRQRVYGYVPRTYVKIPLVTII